MKKTSLFIICAIIFSISFLSCNTTKEIPEGLTAPQLLQKGQECLDNLDYKNAEAYYFATIERFGDNTDVYIETKYELANLYMKKKDYNKAYNALDEILELYSYAMTGDLPPAYKKLAQIQMDKIPPAKLEELQKR